MMGRLIPVTIVGSLVAASLLTASDPAFTDARVALGDNLPEIAARSLETALEADELTPAQRNEARLLLLEALVRANDYEDALAIELPASETAHYWQAHALAGIGQADEALALWQSIEAEPWLEAARQNRIELLLLLQRSGKALELIDEWRDDDKAAIPPLLHARAAIENRDYQRALTALSQKREDSPMASLLRLRALLALGQSEEARQIGNELMEQSLPPGFTEVVRLSLFDAHLSLERYQDAVETLMRPLRADNAAPSPLLLARLQALENDEARRILWESLTAFVKPESLGSEKNPASNSKLWALYILAQNADAREALLLLDDILAHEPAERLAHECRFAKASLLIEQGRREEAVALLQFIRENDDSESSAFATDQLARLAYREDDFEQASKLFAALAETRSTIFSESSLLNQALASLASDSDTTLPAALATSELAGIFTLEKALAQVESSPQEAEVALSRFLVEHPRHRRASEAKLALASIHLKQPVPDLDRIRAELDAIGEQELDRKLSLQLFLLEHAMAAIISDWSKAIERGRDHLNHFPGSRKDSRFTLKLAESYYQNRDFSRAGQLFTDIAEEVGEGPLQDLAYFYSARASLEIPTPQATDAALGALDRLIAGSGPMATDARILRAETQLNKLGQAEAALATLGSLPNKPEDRPKASLLAAEAHRELGSTEASHYQKAIAIYQRLLDEPHTSYALSNRIHYRLARVYRESGELPKALDACWRVINFVNYPTGETQPAWTYYYRCGFEAIDILEEVGRYRAALALAQKLAATEGPGAAEAAERARQIELENHLWRD
ncbi:MAG: tetratricopeptide repeat protein [Verrucomicrobiota bacterium JB023]|nr:tetratricopeptide repeat protein [Verrucomicrobiota bacterium JB023]